jgi:hypothetical protein
LCSTFIMNETEILSFLIAAKRTLKNPHKLLFIRTPKNRAALAALGLSMDDVFRIISWLEPRDYLSGPEADGDGSDGVIMKFLRPNERMVLYIKLKLFVVNGVEHLKVMSFHEEGQYD